MRMLLTAILGGGVLMLCGWDTCSAQDVTPNDTMGGTCGFHDERALHIGVQLAKGGKHRRALECLSPLFSRDSTSLGAEQRLSLAYWLGKVHHHRARRRQALEVWRMGMRQSTSSPGFHYFLADAFIRAAMQRQSTRDYARATTAYLALLRRSDEGLAEQEREIVQKHLRELALILPPRVQRETGVRFDRSDFETSIDKKSGAVGTLMGWWRTQDPVPSTRQNERLFEHLRRVAYARANYSQDGRLDDRGKVYIRLGQPHRDVSIGMPNQETVSRVSTRLRRNEFWTYPHIDQKAYYLFVEKDPEVFDLGGVTDLFPPDMMPGRKYLYEMETVLRELATFHGDYGLPSADVFDRASWSRDNQQYGLGPDPIDGPVRGFVRKIEDRIESVDQQNAERRRRRVPQVYSETSNEYPNLAVASRVSRYLTREGHTRLEMYWSVPADLLRNTDDMGAGAGRYNDGYDVTFLTTLLRRGENHGRQQTKSTKHRIDDPFSLRGVLPPQSVSTIIRDSLFHVNCQWDQYIVSEATGDRTIARRHVTRYDTLTALDDDPATLEISDLKLLSVPEGRSATRIATVGIPYPFSRVDTSQTLGIKFEIYHLQSDVDGRTRYTVDYTVHRQETEKGFFATLFGREDEKETTVTTTHQGQDGRTTEYILLDSKNLFEKESSTVTVTVKITDEVTGQVVARSVSFQTVASIAQK
ncbi:GWxTD domain-containing protein [Salinibacter ruber]|uniref:GWxTD domain-containing protein n=2 Tax=Salinibacter ruber TaxID=146919 RepID=UPI00311AA52F